MLNFNGIDEEIINLNYVMTFYFLHQISFGLGSRYCLLVVRVSIEIIIFIYLKSDNTSIFRIPRNSIHTFENKRTVRDRDKPH